MKKTLLTIVITLMAFCSFAQWTTTAEGTKELILDQNGDIRLVEQKDSSYDLVFSTTDSRFDYAQYFKLGKSKEEALQKAEMLKDAINNNDVEKVNGKDAAGIDHQFKVDKPEGAKEPILLGHTAKAKGIWVLNLETIQKAIKALK
ncbi:MAG: hypothetical protein J6W84_02720 [Bacteroidales bacterium]|nr:hypothetical protein [Bacteroidales bacterium]